MSTHSKNNRHITLLASLGSIIEYYDFVVYGMMASYLSAVFFPPQNPATAVLQTFLIFAVGYLARPVGGAVIGVIGDRFGRRPAFLLSTTLMALSTLMIALLPSYDTLGIYTVLLLVFFRILQGLSFGGELPGAMTIVAEFSPDHRQGRKTSLVLASTSLGALLASGVLYLISANLNQTEILSWGWRLPFLGGGVLGLLLLVARHTIQETPVFLKNKTESRKPLFSLLSNHKNSLLKGAGLTTFLAALIITNLYFPYFIPKYFSYAISEVYKGTTLSLIFVIFVLPLTGIFTDYFSKKIKILRWICGSYIVFSIPIFSLLLTSNKMALIAFLMIQQFYIALFSASFFPTLIRIFSSQVRYTSIALCYNFSWASLATLPMVYTALLNFFESPWVVPIILSGLAGVSLLATSNIDQNEQINDTPIQEIDSIKYDLVG
jgi:MFS family permease